MGELYFSHDYINADTILVSEFGISDLCHQFWPLLYGIMQGENNLFCGKMLDYGNEMLECVQLTMHSLLSGQGTAIIISASDISIPHNPYFTHTMCKGLAQSGGYRGGVGSALRFLKDKASDESYNYDLLF